MLCQAAATLAPARLTLLAWTGTFSIPGTDPVSIENVFFACAAAEARQSCEHCIVRTIPEQVGSYAETTYPTQ